MRILIVIFTLCAAIYGLIGNNIEAAPQSLPLPPSLLQKSSGTFYNSWCRCFYKGVQHGVPYPPSEREHGTPEPWVLPDSSDPKGRVAACCDFALYEQRHFDHSNHPNSEHFPKPVWTPHSDKPELDRCGRWTDEMYCQGHKPFNLFDHLFE
jgi:hypothetical protein